MRARCWNGCDNAPLIAYKVMTFNNLERALLNPFSAALNIALFDPDFARRRATPKPPHKFNKFVIGNLCDWHQSP